MKNLFLIIAVLVCSSLSFAKPSFKEALNQGVKKYQNDQENVKPKEELRKIKKELLSLAQKKGSCEALLAKQEAKTLSIYINDKTSTHVIPYGYSKTLELLKKEDPTLTMSKTGKNNTDVLVSWCEKT